MLRALSRNVCTAKDAKRPAICNRRLAVSDYASTSFLKIRLCKNDVEVLAQQSVHTSVAGIAATAV